MDGSPRTPQERPRSRMFSFTSQRSSSSVPRAELTESPKEKASRKMTSKADPTMAMREAQPVAQALENSTIGSLSSIQHRDVYGNVIADPDRSNPTRPRLERPLDTIRSFEAAIDDNYNKRSSRRFDQRQEGPQSRRASFYPGPALGGQPHPRFQGEPGSPYGNRMGPSRPESYVDAYNHYSNHGNLARYPQSPPNPRRFGPRTHSDPALYGSNSGAYYSPKQNQQSYDTATTASGSGTSQGAETWANSTAPSSENSSVDRIQQVQKPDLGELYGLNGFGGAPQFNGPILEEYGRGEPRYGQPGYGQNVNGGQYAYQGNDIPPPPPPHLPPKDNVQSKPSRGGTLKKSFGQERPALKQGESGEKRKSWLKRRFSKNG